MQVRLTFLFGALMCLFMMGAGSAEETVGRAQAMRTATGLGDPVKPQREQSTSQLVTAEQDRLTQANDPAFRQADEGLQIIYLEDGSSMMELQGRFQHATVAEVQADASVRTHCQDADHLRLGEHVHDSVAIPARANSTAEDH